jgi:hypothetical protein
VKCMTWVNKHQESRASACVRGRQVCVRTARPPTLKLLPEPQRGPHLNSPGTCASPTIHSCASCSLGIASHAVGEPPAGVSASSAARSSRRWAPTSSHLCCGRAPGEGPPGLAPGKNCSSWPASTQKPSVHPPQLLRRILREFAGGGRRADSACVCSVGAIAWLGLVLGP